jgi:hypothetical protein
MSRLYVRYSYNEHYQPVCLVRGGVAAPVEGHGEAGWTGRMVPLTVDGLVYASSMVMLDSARRRTPVPVLRRWLLGLGITATLAANVAHQRARSRRHEWPPGR